MKLAEALSLRKDLDTRISAIRERLENSVRVQEGTAPAEDPEELLAELDRCVNQLEHYIYCINITNMKVVADDGRTMTKLLAERDAISKRIKVLRNTFEHATCSGNRYRGEVRYVTTIDVKPLRQQLDKFSHQYRQLDMEIQKLNFSFDLIEE